MMPEAVGTQLLDFGALGIMVLFLIWQHLGMQKRLDKLVASFQEQIDRIDNTFDERVELMRTRYDAVIVSIRKDCREAEDKVAAQRDKLQEDLAGVVQSADRRLEALIAKLND